MVATSDLKRVRIGDNGWTLRSPKEDRTSNLCFYCTLEETCEVAEKMRRITAKHSQIIAVTDCLVYRPAIMFRRPLIGLENAFNTFRLGAAFARRVKIGMKVALWDAQGDNEIGVAEVIEVTTGRYSEIAGQHARYNHTQLDLPPEDAPENLFKVMQRSYGTTYCTPDRVVSVLYLRRLS